MEKNRVKRYDEKLENILARKVDIEEWTAPYEAEAQTRS